MSYTYAEIKNHIEKIAVAFPQLRERAEIAMSATKTSWDRSQSETRFLSVAAKHSIAVYLMTFVSFGVDAGACSSRNASVRFLFDVACDYGDSSRLVHEKCQAGKLIGWTGEKGGPWKKPLSDNLKMTLFRKPETAGGEWSIAINGAPLYYDFDPNRLMSRTKDAIALILSENKDADLNRKFTNQKRI